MASRRARKSTHHKRVPATDVYGSGGDHIHLVPLPVLKSAPEHTKTCPGRAYTHLLSQDAPQDGAHGGNLCRGRGAHRGGGGIGPSFPRRQEVRRQPVLLQRVRQERRECGGVLEEGPPAELLLEESNDWCAGGSMATAAVVVLCIVHPGRSRVKGESYRDGGEENGGTRTKKGAQEEGKREKASGADDKETPLARLGVSLSTRTLIERRWLGSAETTTVPVRGSTAAIPCCQGESAGLAKGAGSAKHVPKAK